MRRTRASPRNGLRARPTCNGPVGFALVCSRRIRSFRAGDVPYDSPSDRTPERTSCAQGTASTVKLAYGPSARSGAIGGPGVTRDARFAIDAGDALTFFAATITATPTRPWPG